MDEQPTPEWREFQHAVAAVFNAAGCDVRIEHTVEGARGIHNVDVAVYFKKHGIECLWIVECKFWNTPVPKEKVLTLQAIVADCGADRGLMVSKCGFQSGAVRAANKTNITLTNLEDLSSYIDDKMVEIESLRRQLADTQEQLDDYLCPHCGASLSERTEIPYNDKHSGMMEIFECGYQRDGAMIRPCPFSDEFPRLDEFDMQIHMENGWYLCFPKPTTNKSRKVRLQTGRGSTENEARAMVAEHYAYLTTPLGQEFRGRWIFRSGQRKPDASE